MFLPIGSAWRTILDRVETRFTASSASAGSRRRCWITAGARQARRSANSSREERRFSALRARVRRRLRRSIMATTAGDDASVGRPARTVMGRFTCDRRRRSAPYPTRITERLEYWADRAPDRVFLAQRGRDGLRGRGASPTGRRWPRVRSLAQALLDRGLSIRAPVAHSVRQRHRARPAGAGLHVRRRAVRADRAGLLRSQAKDFGTLAQIFERIRPGLVFAADGAAVRAGAAAGCCPQTSSSSCRRQAERAGCVAATPFAELEAAQRRPPSTRRNGTGRTGHDRQDPVHVRDRPAVPKGVINTQRMLCANQEMIRSVLPLPGR